jgi:hypothetical protein
MTAKFPHGRMGLNERLVELGVYLKITRND